jgi:hypothetical protein
MEELNTVYVIETSEALYVVEDEIYDGKVLDGILELAVQFDTIDDAEKFLEEMKEFGIQGKVKTAKIWIEVVSE